MLRAWAHPSPSTEIQTSGHRRARARLRAHTGRNSARLVAIAMAVVSTVAGMAQAQEDRVEAAGTKTLLIAADPGKVDLLSAAEIEPALKAGRDRAVGEADRVKAFWA